MVRLCVPPTCSNEMRPVATVFSKAEYDSNRPYKSRTGTPRWVFFLFELGVFSPEIRLGPKKTPFVAQERRFVYFFES